jgi:hypothetical protein
VPFAIHLVKQESIINPDTVPPSPTTHDSLQTEIHYYYNFGEAQCSATHTGRHLPNTLVIKLPC